MTSNPVDADCIKARRPPLAEVTEEMATAVVVTFRETATTATNAALAWAVKAAVEQPDRCTPAVTTSCKLGGGADLTGAGDGAGGGKSCSGGGDSGGGSGGIGKALKGGARTLGCDGSGGGGVKGGKCDCDGGGGGGGGGGTTGWGGIIRG
jgi:hypothetical protein